MSTFDTPAGEERWLLPEGVEELLPAQAARVERLRRELLDLFARWGYELVIPPLIEFTDSLLIGLGKDLDLQTFTLTDQLSGRLLGVRSDITAQTARIDAHSLRREGPVRLCYAGSVLHTRRRSPFASRSPIQLGAELYGDASAESDLEVVCLMLETLRRLGVREVTLDLGHTDAASLPTDERVRQEILDISRETTLYEWTSQKAMKPLVIDRAKGIYMWDVDGKRYMDFNSQLMCVNIGHGDQRVIEGHGQRVVLATRAQRGVQGQPGQEVVGLGELAQGDRVVGAGRLEDAYRVASEPNPFPKI